MSIYIFRLSLLDSINFLTFSLVSNTSLYLNSNFGKPDLTSLFKRSSMLKIVSASFCLKVPNISFSQSELKEALFNLLMRSSFFSDNCWYIESYLFFNSELARKFTNDFEQSISSSPLTTNIFSLDTSKPSTFRMKLDLSLSCSLSHGFSLDCPDK